MHHKLLVFFLLICAVRTVLGSAIVGAEYFVGADPGVGLGTALSMSGADTMAVDIADIVIPAGSLPAGTHDVGVRVRDDAGRWSNPLIRRFTVKTFTLAGGVDPSNPNAASNFPKPVQSLTQAEYFVGTDPGQGNGTPLALTGSDGLARDLEGINIPVGSLPAGTHNIGVRVRDEAGRWSNPLIRRFTVKSFTLAGGVDPANPNAASSFPKPVQSLAQAEYFVGTDPGQGNGTPLALTGSDGLARDLEEITIPVGSLPAGTHDVGVRVRDEAGRWSNPLIRRFTVKSFTLAGGVDPSNPNAASSFPKPVQPLVQAEYFVGTDPGQGNGTALTLPPGGVLSQDIADVAIPLTMPPGTYNVGVRVRDEAGRWSNPLLRRFTLYRTEVLAAQRPGTKLVDLEYDLIDGPRVYTVTALISSDGGLTWTVPTGSLTGDAGNSVAPGRSKHLVWHAGEDWDAGFSENMRFRVLAYETSQDTPSGFVPLVPGSFTMGSPAGEPGRNTDEIERSVAMPKPFFLKTTEVTWNEWNSVRNQGTAYGYTDIASGRNGLNGDGSGNHPVTDVSWVDAVKWCNLRSEIEGKKPVYYSDVSLNPATVVRTGIPTIYPLWNAGGYRLPTEAEWESACRAGAASAFSSGPITNTTVDAYLDPVGWYAANSGANTRPVGGKAANARGLFDMHGNVREWCWDAHGTYASGPQWSPVGVTVGAARVVRGGSWTTDAAACRSAARTSSGQNSRATDIGFRVALNFTGLTDAVTSGGIPVDSRDPAAGNLIAGMRPAFNGPVFAMASQPDGKVLLGGDFTTVDGLSRHRLARVNPDGSLDSAFNPGADSTVHSIAVLPGGKILLGGDFSSVASGPAEFLARLNTDGTLDTTFNPAADYIVHCMVLQPDGRILIGGDFDFIGGVPRHRIARLNADGSLDPAFNAGADGGIRTMALQSDGKLLLGGLFSMVAGESRSRIARLNADGTLDTGFIASADGEVSCIAVQTGGQILAGGAFSSLGGLSRNGLARLSSSGVADASFNPDMNGPVRTLVQQADGRLLVGGEFTAVGGAPRKRLAALGAGGTLDSSFGLDFNGTVHCLNLLPTGKLVTGGTFSTVNGVTRNGLAWIDHYAPVETLSAMSSSRVRWLRGPTMAEAAHVTFDLSTDGGAGWLPLGSAARIDGGWERTGVNLPAQGLLRATAVIPAGRGNGSSALASSSATFSGVVTIPEIAVQTASGAEISDGGDYSFGTLTMGSGKSTTFVIRNPGYGDLTGLTITKNGANAADFQITTSPVSPVSGPAGSTTLVIRFAPGDSGPRSAGIHILNNDSNENPFDIQVSGAGVIAGQLAGSVDPNAGNKVSAVAVQPDGKVIIGGTFTSVGGQSRGRIARLLPDLSLESIATFAVGTNSGSGAGSEVTSVAVQPDGRILLAGTFNAFNSQGRNRIVRLLPDGSLEPTATFNPGSGSNAGPNNAVQAMALQPDGKIVIAGNFTAFYEYPGSSRTRIARLLSNGTAEDSATFNTGTGANGIVHCVALQPDGKIIIGGVFTTINGQSRERLARLLPDGSLDPGFIANADGKVSSLAVQPDGKIIVGGLFATIGGMARGGIARLLPSGEVEAISGFDPGSGTDGEVNSIALQADASILVGGSFTAVNGDGRAYIARLYPNGTLEDSITFDTVAGPDAPVRGLALRPDGTVIAGGDFTDFNGTPRGRLTLLANQPAMDELVIGSSARIDWNRSGTAAEISSPALEISTDGGTAWVPLPPLVRKQGGWENTGLSLPSSGIVRARGRTSGGMAGTSSGLVEIIKPFINAPALTTLPATSVTINSAVLNATVTPNGVAHVRFEYGPSASYGSLTPLQTLTGSAEVETSAPLSGISGLYHFRLIAETTGGTYRSEDLTFVTAPEPPVAVTANPVSVTTAGATLVGAVNPKGRQTSVHFEYGTTTLYGNTTPVQVLPPGNAGVELGVPVTGLAADATYHYRIIAVSSGGTSVGSDVSFQAGTGGAPTATPSVTTAGVTGVSTNSATLTGTVNPNGGFTNAFFEYGLTDALGGVTPALGAGNGTVPANLSWNLTGLSPGTTWYYRLVAANSLGTARGILLNFTTGFPPPVVVTRSAAALTTTTARVTGSVRGSNDATQVFFDYGTGGVVFPSSVNATPSTVTGNNETAVTADLTNLQGGITYHFRIRAVNSGGTALGETRTFTPAILSGLAQLFPPAPPPAQGLLTVNIEPPGIGGGWRMAGEQQWRAAGTTAESLTTGDRIIEFRPVPGYIQPPQEIVSVVSGSPATVFEASYYFTPTAGSGGLSVTLKPDALAGAGVPEAERARWRLTGEVQWRDSAATVTGLFPGNYLVECKPVPGRTTPPPASVAVVDGQTSLAALTYFLADSLTGTPPSVLEFPVVSAAQNLPYAYTGQIRSDAGLSSGFVVKPRVVATAGHVVWDDATLSAATGLQWLFQRDRGIYEPKPQIPRGFYIFDGYAAQRTLENSPGSSSPQSQNLDVAALYFLEDAGRGGFGGFLASDLTNNEFLLSGAPKMLVGYPVDGIDSVNQGRMHATPAANVVFSQGFGRTYATSAIRSSGGNSGGPLCIQHQGSYYPAAVYLGGTAQTVVRAIDSEVIDLFNRAETSGGGGQNNTGGGITHTSVPIAGTTGKGRIKVHMRPDNPLPAGAGWWLEQGPTATSTSPKGQDAIANGLTPGTYRLRLTTLSGFQVPRIFEVPVSANLEAQVLYDYEPETTPLQAWRLAKFGTTANAGNAADNADPDKDGLENLVEFAFGLNPNIGSADLMPAWVKSGHHYILSFTQPAAAGGITYTAEHSSSLSSDGWTAMPDTGTAPRHHFSISAEEAGRRFLRVRVTAP